MFRHNTLEKVFWLLTSHLLFKGGSLKPMGVSIKPLEKGLLGEKLTSDSLYQLTLVHNHHDFTSTKTYAKSQGKGADISTLLLEMEVKYYPSSKLVSKSQLEELVKPRFTFKKLHQLLTVIWGRISPSFVKLCNKEGIVVIHATNPKHLTSLLRYYLVKLGILKPPTVQKSKSKAYTTTAVTVRNDVLANPPTTYSHLSIAFKPPPPSQFIAPRLTPLVRDMAFQISPRLPHLSYPLSSLPR